MNRSWWFDRNVWWNVLSNIFKIIYTRPVWSSVKSIHSRRYVWSSVAKSIYSRRSVWIVFPSLFTAGGMSGLVYYKSIYTRRNVWSSIL